MSCTNEKKLGGITQQEYARIHYWLRETFGKADKCDNSMCTKISKRYEWALLKNKSYRYERDNFAMLCKSCHSKVDIDDDAKKKMSAFWKTHETYKVDCKICGKKTLSYHQKPKCCPKCRKKLVRESFARSKANDPEHYKEYGRQYYKKYWVKNQERLRIMNLAYYHKHKKLLKNK